MTSVNSEPTTEQRILEAAEKEFMTKGFTGARTTEIAKAAGTTHAMLHYYFRTKKNLFEKIIAEKIQDLQKVVLIAFDNDNMTLREQLETMISRHLDFLAENPSLPGFILMEMNIDPTRQHTLIEHFKPVASNAIGRLQKSIDLAVKNGECTYIDAKTLILDIVSLNLFPFLASMVVKSMFGESDESYKKFIEEKKRENITLIRKRLSL